MKQSLFLITAMCVVNVVSAQYVYTIKADSVKITNHCDTAELIIENHTQNILGFLYNKGKGRTEFRRILKLNDSTLIFGDDTLSFRGNIQANNGLGIFEGKVQLGQPIGESGNPAQLLLNREVPLNGYEISFSNTGRSIGLKNSTISVLGDTAKLTLTESVLQKHLTLKTTPDYSVIGTGTPSVYMYPEGGFLLNFDTASPQDPGIYYAKINGNALISTDENNGWPNGLLVENRTALSTYSGGQIAAYTNHLPNAADQRLGVLGLGYYQGHQGFVPGVEISAFSEEAAFEDPEGAPIRPSYLKIEMANFDQAVMKERMRITSRGDVGIGITSPASRLHVGGGLTITNDDNGSDGNLSITELSNLDKGIKMIRTSWNESSTLQFGDFVSNPEQMVFFDSKNIAIGNNVDNGQKLQVYGTGYFTDTLSATTMGNSDSSNRVATTAFVKNVMGSPAISIINSGTSDFAVTAGVLTKLQDLTGAGSHSVTLPSASTYSGQRILLWNMNSSGNSWTFSTSVTLPDGTTSNSIANQTTIELISDGTVWIKWK